MRVLPKTAEYILITHTRINNKTKHWRGALLHWTSVCFSDHAIAQQCRRTTSKVFPAVKGPGDIYTTLNLGWCKCARVRFHCANGLSGTAHVRILEGTLATTEQIAFFKFQSTKRCCGVVRRRDRLPRSDRSNATAASALESLTFCFEKPGSMTKTMPSMVKDVSAMLVDTTTCMKAQQQPRWSRIETERAFAWKPILKFFVSKRTQAGELSSNEICWSCFRSFFVTTIRVVFLLPTSLTSPILFRTNKSVQKSSRSNVAGGGTGHSERNISKYK